MSKFSNPASVANPIPLTDWFRTSKEHQYIAEALNRGHLHGGGQFSSRCESFLRESHSSAAVHLTSSCTSALELAAQILAIKPGDEVLIPSYTFVSCATAFCSYGATPQFCDIDESTLNISPDDIRRKITHRTRAVVVVHYAGIAADLDAIQAIASECSVPIVEDNAHGLLGRYKGRPLGTFGALATLSFDQQKNYSCGEGGALLVNSLSLQSRAESAADCGTNRAAFERGEEPEYVWIGEGSKRRPSELQAALLWSQFESRALIHEGRRRVWMYYSENLRSWAERAQVMLPQVPPWCDPSFHIFYLLMPSRSVRDALINELRSQGIGCGSHYPPLHLSPAGTRYHARRGDCPVAERIAGQIVRIPCYPHLTAAELERIIAALLHFVP